MKADMFQQAGYISLTLLATMLSFADGHGRLRDPPSRSSAWRDGFKTPPDYNDTEGFCGGFERQWLVNKGKCGVCGDPFDESVKPHQAPGGVFATGTIVRNYTEGQVITVKIDITALHKGYYEFKLCPNNNVNQDPPQECFDRFPLTFINGGSFTKYDVSNLVTGKLEGRLQLPAGVTCTQCILQWQYVTGNRWGTCTNGTQGLGCGPQESFRACSDIGIYPAEMGVVPVTTTSQPVPISEASTTVRTSTQFATPPPVTTVTPRPDVTDPTQFSTLPTSTSTETPAVTIFPTIPPSAVNTTACSSYLPVSSQLIVNGMIDWCNTNCRRGYCPSNYCVCVP